MNNMESFAISATFCLNKLTIFDIFITLLADFNY